MKRFIAFFGVFACAMCANAQSFSKEFTQRAWEKACRAEKLTQQECVAVADSIHKAYVTLDSHNDTALWVNHPDGNYGVTKGQVTFPLMEKGGLDAAFFAIYLEQGKLNDKARDSVFNYAIKEIKLFKKYVKDHKSQAELAYCPNDVRRIKKLGKRAVVLALENGYGVGLNVNRVDEFFKQGVRYITLSHNYNNDICDASMSKTGESYGGLSEFGYSVVKRMNDLGMIIDVSHAASSTLKDVLEFSKAPIVATHSAAWAIKNHNRNLKDDELRAIAQKGGLIQVATGRFFLSTLPKKEVTIKHLANHIDYIKNIVGIKHIGLGTDFDGGGGVVGLENCSKMKSLTVELLKRGYTPSELELFWGGNFLRVWQSILSKTSE